MNEIKDFSEKLLDKIISESSVSNGYDINNGSCDFFAEAIVAKFPEKNLEIITTDDLINYIDGNKEMPEKISKNIELVFSQMKSKLYCEESFIDLNTILYEMGYHEWVLDPESGMHYDAESTSGVCDITEMPFIRDHLFIALASSGYFLDKRDELTGSIKKIIDRVMINVSQNSDSLNDKNKLINITMKNLERIYSGITTDIKSQKKQPYQDLSM